jgi:SAM-dependent methyltransferase
VAYVLSVALFGRYIPLPDFPTRPDLVGIGLSDWGYAPVLSSKLGYRNTFYDEEPRLDITDPPEDLLGTLDFLISSDVFEHVPPPVEKAFSGAFRLLKPGGVLVMTVPYLLSGETIEWYPELNDFEIVERNGDRILQNRTVDGRLQTFDRLRFHGGPGLVLEMRILTHADLMRHLREAGFGEVVDWRDRRPEWGAFWREPHSFPVVARRPLGEQ